MTGILPNAPVGVPKDIDQLPSVTRAAFDFPLDLLEDLAGEDNAPLLMLDDHEAQLGGGVEVEVFHVHLPWGALARLFLGKGFIELRGCCLVGVGRCDELGVSDFESVVGDADLVVSAESYVVSFEGGCVFVGHVHLPF